MPTHFTFQVDRFHEATQPLKFYANVDLTGAVTEVAVGQQLVYRGIVELDGKPRYTFDLDGAKAFTGDRGQLELGLKERFDELAQA